MVGEAEHGETVMPEIAIQIVTLVLVVVGAVIAWRMYAASEVSKAVPRGNRLTQAARNDLYQDQFNEGAFMTPALALTRVAAVGDEKAVDGLVNGAATLTEKAGRVVATTQTGNVRGYASFILGGVLVALAVVLGFRL